MFAPFSAKTYRCIIFAIWYRTFLGNIIHLFPITLIFASTKDRHMFLSQAERTHNLVHAWTFSSTWMHSVSRNIMMWIILIGSSRGHGRLQEKQRDFQVFLEETKHTTIGFTGGNFYYINRHYIVTVRPDKIARTAMIWTNHHFLADQLYSFLKFKIKTWTKTKWNYLYQLFLIFIKIFYLFFSVLH